MSYWTDIGEYWHSLALKCTRKLVHFYSQLVPKFTNISSITLYYLIFIWKNVHKKLQYQLSSSIPFSFRQRSLSSINCSGSSGHITANPVRRAWNGQLLKLTNAISLLTDIFWYNNELIQLVFNGHQIDLYLIISTKLTLNHARCVYLRSLIIFIRS